MKQSLQENLLPKSKQTHSIYVTSAFQDSQSKKEIKRNYSTLYEKISPKRKQISPQAKELEWEKSQESFIMDEVERVSSANNKSRGNFLSIKSDDVQLFPKRPLNQFRLNRKSRNQSQNYEEEQEKIVIKNFIEEKPNQRLLNHRIFHLSQVIQKKLYAFNLVMNTIFRTSLLVIIALLGNEKKFIFMEIFIGLETLTILLYCLAIMKMLYTRSDEESIYFQKFFYERQYADIHMDRMFRKHFTLQKICNNTWAFFNPLTKFKENIKISFLRQQIFKRMELVIVIVPFLIIFLLNRPIFLFGGYKHSDLVVSGVICLQVLRTATHYLIVYIYK